jgi:hypothetical protein
VLSCPGPPICIYDGGWVQKGFPSSSCMRLSTTSGGRFECRCPLRSLFSLSLCARVCVCVCVCVWVSRWAWKHRATTAEEHDACTGRCTSRTHVLDVHPIVALRGSRRHFDYGRSTTDIAAVTCGFVIAIDIFISVVYSAACHRRCELCVTVDIITRAWLV